MMRWASWTIGMAMAMGAAVAVGCGGDDNGGGKGGSGGSGSSGTVTGLPADKQLKDLTQDEAVQACEESGKYFNEQVPVATQNQAGCVIAAVIKFGAMPPTKEECDVYVADCVSKAEPVDPDCSMAGSGDLSDCTVTVSEAEACVKAQVEQLKPLYDKLTCDRLLNSPGEIQTVLEDLKQSPAACSPFESKCPGFFGTKPTG